MDIAQQLMEWDVEGASWDVILGGGKEEFVSEKRDLLTPWKTRTGGACVETTSELKAATSLPLLGLFSESHMDFEVDRDTTPKGQPSIAKMTEKAVGLLADKFPNGLFLMVEGGRIDHPHHGTSWYRALGDTIALDKAVQTTQDMTSSEDTLLVVTADHGHTNGGLRHAAIRFWA